MSGDEDTPHKLPEAQTPQDGPASAEHEVPGGRSTGIRHTGAPAPAAAPGDKDPATDSAVGDEQEWVGRVIDERYRVVEKLGEGGMGAVFVAEHVKLQKPVALKVILPEFAGDGEMAARFAREAMASAKLDHPHVASALDYGTLPEGGAYLVMQLVKGRGLSSLLEQHGAITWPAACGIVAQVADALAAAHAEGIVHRDLKPENILLEQRDESSELVKVLDFGIARVSAEETGASEAPARALTRLGTVMGTPGYMSPEQAVGEQVDQRTDLYALGVILWEMIAGRPLFEGDDLTAIITKQLTEMPMPLGQAAQDASIPGALEQLVGRLLARKPEGRPERANEVRDTLRQLAFSVTPPAGVPMPAPPTGSWATPHATGAGREPSAAQPAAAAAGTARTMLADATGPHSHTGIEAPAVPARGTTAGRGSRVPTRVDIAGRSIPVPAIVAGCAAPLVIGALAVVLVFALGGDDGSAEGNEAKGDEGGGLAGLLGPVKSPELLEPRIPPEVQDHIETMMDSGSRRKRREAAQWLKDHEPADEVPEFALAVADFELARGCRAMKKELSNIRDVGDDRALPALDRIADKPRRGCGFLNTRDCYGCLRRELADTQAELRGEDTDE